MVCQRCVLAVRKILEELKLPPVYIHLGEVLLAKSPTGKQQSELEKELAKIGFELLDDTRQQEIEKIKTLVIRHIHYQEDPNFSFPSLLAKELNREYSTISKLFSETEGITIEQFVIRQKIEKVKELLAYREMNLNEISFELGYSSAAHLSAQFKKVTGLTPSQFKKQAFPLRKPLDAVAGTNRI
ncbi:MAG: helix-turn-helix transcriptional regulator [Bacteroidota bacterium]|nr:helix-turn-helix transcriptional regulator [Bacteroidota bacterium]